MDVDVPMVLPPAQELSFFSPTPRVRQGAAAPGNTPINDTVAASANLEVAVGRDIAAPADLDDDAVPAPAAKSFWLVGALAFVFQGGYMREKRKSDDESKRQNLR
jgi:hypothetical protein